VEQQSIPQITADDDALLVQGARDRDEAAIRAIMQHNNRRLFRVARGR
jgi:RNA polymerase sigma-70 factor, ECF subfamily